MKKAARKGLCAALAAVMMISASSCGSKKIEGGLIDEIGKSTTAAESAEPAATEAPAHEAAPAETTKKKKKEKAAVKENFNQLTGLYDVADSAKGKRPCAVMVNNIEASLPQYGIYKADIILEAVAEGGITRLMALYADESDIPNVCSVRSARYYYMLFAQAFDAVYLHWGGDKLVCYPMMEELSIDHIDGMNNTDIFDRDYDRMEYMDYEHTGYLNGSQVMGEITALGIRQEIKDGYERIFSFYDEFTKPSGDDCTQAALHFSNQYYSEFDYDKKSKTYKKLHNGSEHMDLAEGKQLEFTNLLVLEVPEIKEIRPDESLIVGFDTDGGSGYLVTAGKVQRISWSKQGDFSKLTLTDEGGSEVRLNTGKTYIGIVQSGGAAF